MNHVAILFDLDGTLLDSALDVENALNKLAERYQQTTTTYTAVCEQMSYGSAGLLPLVFPKLKSTDSNFESLRQEFFDIYQRYCLDHSPLYPGVRDMLDTLDAQGIRWGIVTNKVTRLTKPILRQLTLLDRCAVLVCADTCAHKKPHPEPLLFACKKLDVDPAQTYFIGDGHYDYLAARNAGLRFIAALYGYVPSTEVTREWETQGVAHQVAEILPLLPFYQTNEHT